MEHTKFERILLAIVFVAALAQTLAWAYVASR